MTLAEEAACLITRCRVLLDLAWLIGTDEDRRRAEERLETARELLAIVREGEKDD